MTKEDKDKLLSLMSKERNSYVEHLRIEEAKLNGKIAGADYMLNCLGKVILDYLYDEVIEDGKNDDSEGMDRIL